MNKTPPPLKGVLVVNTGLNLPAPRAAQMLHEMGASIVKVEPPQGDTFEQFCKAWYLDMLQGVERRRLDLKTASGREMMRELLAEADILITSQRPSALARMGLAVDDLRRDYPRLAIVTIIGSANEDAHLPGHDLTYQARAGLLTPPQLPRSLIADLSGAQQAVIAALSLLHAGGGVQQVALSEAAQIFHEPLAYHMSRPGDFLGGAHAGYNIYQTADGYIALAALEHYFWPALHELFPHLPDDPLSSRAHEILRAGFRSRATAVWLTLAREKDIPLEAII
jgi:crotonobetainyl-CoA:carnitine CoA-transferase CaiB-like acyl-CoA transferase